MSKGKIPRMDSAGGPKPKQGKPILVLPTQSLDDDVYIEDVPLNAPKLVLPAYKSPHPRNSAHKLAKMEVYQGNDQQVFVRQTYTKFPGKALTGGTVNASTFGAKGAITRQRVETGTEPETGFSVIESTVEPEDAVTAYRTTIKVDEWPPLTTVKIDPESFDVFTITKTKKPPGEITPGAVIDGDGNLIITEREDETADRAVEVVTVIPPAAAHDEETAVLSTKFTGYTFSGRLNIQATDYYGTAIGYKTPHATLVEATVKTYWVISDTKPAIEYDKILPSSITINGVDYKNVLHNSATRNYNGAMLTIPPTSPSYSEYTGLVILSGFMTLTNGSKDVTGSGTTFTMLAPGCQILPDQVFEPAHLGTPPLAYRTIDTITDNTHLTLVAPWAGSTMTTIGLSSVILNNRWIGTQRLISGSVTPTQYKKRWKVELAYIEMR